MTFVHRFGMATVRSASGLGMSAVLAFGCGYGTTATTSPGGAPPPGSGSSSTAGGSTGTVTTGNSTATTTTTGGSTGTDTGGSTDTTTAGSTDTTTGGSTDTTTGGSTGTTTSGSTGTTTGGTTGVTTTTTTGGTTATMTSTATATTPAAWGTPTAGGPTGTGVTAMVTVNAGTTVGTIGPEFIGFSYEKTHITNGSLTSANTSLISLYKLLGSPVMRLGADDVDNCNWAGTGTAPAKPTGQPFSKSIVSGMVDQICTFVGATGTRIIYGVNFKSDNVTASAAEAAYAMSKCASSIYGFEIGNEINRYGTWASLQSEWESIATAIVATPGAMLIGPAGGGGDSSSLSTPFAQNRVRKVRQQARPSHTTLLRRHRRHELGDRGPPADARFRMPRPPGRARRHDSTMNTASTMYKIANAYRLGEVNTFAGHGQMGVSDTLIAGLWGIDLMFVTAEHGGSGVNFHGGETGMDGSRPFYYMPIMETNGVVVAVQPLYYGMLLFSLAGQGPMVSTTVTTSNMYFTAYAIKANGFTSVVLDNKDATNGVNATVDLGSAVTSASAMYLQGTPAGSLTAASGSVTLGGATISTDAVWTHDPPYTQTTSGNTVTVYIPPASAAMVRVLP